jgi:hypothetical protein
MPKQFIPCSIPIVTMPVIAVWSLVADVAVLQLWIGVIEVEGPVVDRE